MFGRRYVVSFFVFVGLVLASFAGDVFAQSGSVDVSSITSLLTEASAAVAVIGLAVLTVIASIKVYNWVRAAL